MSFKKLIQTATLREIRIPDDYEQLAALLNIIERGSNSATALEEEDRQIPSASNLKLDENGLLAGLGRTRVIAETEKGKIIGYGACFRAPWVDPGQVGSVFCVHPEFRGQGVGEMILSHIEKWANDHQASVFVSIVMDWIDGSLPFVKKRGFTMDAHIYDLELHVNEFDVTAFSGTVEKAEESGIRFMTLAELPGEESERKLNELFEETAKDNPGQYGSVPPFDQVIKQLLDKQ
ncbi:hypothetical protein DRW41_08415 [Neobacillus piezotolerans]|uniref:N-acetyltransferase domain-containing protein n=1 Tax=Neobacillus piezotolerans TaxID=2259171 RepID=A0A3D8GUJ6_9BACI|nr:GNAT family N-acetyltransferase [Neobacillus piezotolerans]RDU37831.1 hypothetical protein DRW41_08415 [Neobacillus piezotolerans]